MARDFNGSTQYLIGGDPAVTDWPLTISAWFHPDAAIAATHNAVSLGDASVDNQDQVLLQFRTAGANDVVAAAAFGANFRRATGTTHLAPGTWYHITAVYGSATSREIFVDGTSEATNTQSLGTFTWSNIDRIVVAAHAQSTIDGFVDAQIADVAIWDVALDGREIAALAAGVRPNHILRSSLVHWWPIWGRHSPEIDLTGNLDLTLTASPGYVAGPPVSTRIFFVVPSFEAEGAAPVSNTATGQGEAQQGIAKENTGAVESKGPITNTATGEAEALSSPAATATGESEAIESATATATGEAEGLTGIANSATGEAEAAGPATSTVTGEAEALDTIAADATGEAEAIETVVGPVTGQAENTAGAPVSNTVTGQSSAGQGITATITGQIELLATPIAARTGEAEAVEVAIAAATGEAETIEAAIATATGQAEAIETAVGPVTGQAENTAGAPVSSTVVGQAAAGQGIAAAATGQIEALATPIAARTGEAEVIAALLGSATGSAESILTAAPSDVTGQAAALLGVRASNVGQVEALGVEIVGRIINAATISARTKDEATISAKIDERTI